MMWDVFRSDYRAHDGFVGPARECRELWRLAFGVMMAVAIFMFLSELLWSAVLSAQLPGEQEAFVDDVFAGRTPGAVIFVLMQLALLIPATAFVAMALHRRLPRTLLGPPKTFISQFVMVFLAQIALLVLLIALPPYTIGGDSPAANLSLSRWLVLLPLALGAVLLQCAAEEIAFRGYIQQQLAARFRHPLVWMGLPSALFAFGHYLPEDAGSNALPIALLAGLFGLAMADLTARAGTLGPAIAVHTANNISALLLIAPADDMAGLALFTFPFGLADEDLVRAILPVDLAATFVAWLAARLVLRR